MKIEVDVILQVWEFAFAFRFQISNLIQFKFVWLNAIWKFKSPCIKFGAILSNYLVTYSSREMNFWAILKMLLDDKVQIVIGFSEISSFFQKTRVTTLPSSLVGKYNI